MDSSIEIGVMKRHGANSLHVPCYQSKNSGLLKDLDHQLLNKGSLPSMCSACLPTWRKHVKYGGGRQVVLDGSLIASHFEWVAKYMHPNLVRWEDPYTSTSLISGALNTFPAPPYSCIERTYGWIIECASMITFIIVWDIGDEQTMALALGALVFPFWLRHRK